MSAYGVVVRRGWGAAAAVVAVVLLAAVGCTGDADPQPTGTVATTEPSSTEPSPTEPSESPSPTVTVPPLPPEATTQDAAGAEAFVRHWFDLVNYGYRTADFEPVTAASEAECDWCTETISLAKDLVTDGDVVEGDALVLDSAESPPPDGGVVLVSIAFHRGTFAVVSLDGTSDEFQGEPAQPAGAIVAWVGDRWVLSGVGA